MAIRKYVYIVTFLLFSAAIVALHYVGNPYVDHPSMALPTVSIKGGYTTQRSPPKSSVQVSTTRPPSSSAPVKNIHLPISPSLKIPLEPVQLTGVDSSDIYLSILSMPKYHRTRLSVLLFTWMQTVNPDQVRIVTEESDDEWIKMAASLGYHVVPSRCPNLGAHNVLMMCCKSGRQFEEYYLARKAGKMYSWYCHVDDDIYVNIVRLTQLLHSHDPNEKLYLGQWYEMGYSKRISHMALGIKNFLERKRDDFRYVSGNAYCISDALMTELEKYLSGERFVDSCRTAKAEMDDVMVGVAVESLLGYDLVHVGDMKGEMIYPRYNDSILRSLVTVSLGRVVVSNPKFGFEDSTRLLSYHCVLYPEVSWCRRK